MFFSISLTKKRENLFGLSDNLDYADSDYAKFIVVSFIERNETFFQ